MRYKLQRSLCIDGISVKVATMSTPKDTVLRQLVLLQLIPRYPARIDTGTLLEKLADRGFYVDARTVQRDLKDRLSVYFPIICHDETCLYRWRFDSQAQFNLPELDTPTALALHIAEAQLRSLLPQSVADQLKPQFDAATKYLENMEHNGLAYWSRNVRVLPNGKALQPAAIDEDVWRKLSQALLSRQQVQVTYLSRAQGEVRSFVLHPEGLVSRYTISYLLAIVEGYDNIRKFALHRIQSISVLEEEAMPCSDFDIDAYISSGEFGWKSTVGNAEVELVADIHPQVAWLLNETPLSKQQSITPIANSRWQRLVATVPDDNETRWWLYGLNSNIRIYQPQAWVDEIRHHLHQQITFYEKEHSVRV